MTLRNAYGEPVSGKPCRDGLLRSTLPNAMVCNLCACFLKDHPNGRSLDRYAKEATPLTDMPTDGKEAAARFHLSVIDAGDDIGKAWMHLRRGNPPVPGPVREAFFRLSDAYQDYCTAIEEARHPKAVSP